MNIDRISIKNANNLYNKNINFKEGDILTGHIKSLKDNIYTIYLENKGHINIDKDKIVGNVNDTIYFRVEKDNSALRQIIEDENIMEKQSMNYTHNNPNIKTLSLDNFIEMNKSQNHYKKFLDKNSQPSIQENIIYSNKIKSKLSHLANTITEDSLQKLANNGLNAKKLDVMSLSDYLNESLGIDKDSENTLDEKTLKEIKEEKEKSMKMDLNMNGVDEEETFRFESILSKVGLAKTDKNIAILQNVKGKIDNIENIDKDAILNVIKKGNKATIEDLYTSKYTRFSNKEKIGIDGIENVDSQIENILKQNGIDINEENINIAKDFIQNEIDISFENVEKYKKLENIKDDINIKRILEQSAKNILKNENPLNVEIFNNSSIEENYSKYKNILPNVLPEHIQGLIDNKIKINLKNIMENYKNIDTNNVKVTPDAISEKLNLYKIQLKLTTEAMYSLYNKDININTKPLQNVINHLEALEEENYKKCLEINKAPVTQENVHIIKSVVSTIKNIYPNVVYNVFKDIVEQKVDFSLAGINKSLKAKNIIDDFETFKTMPNRSFGDSINKLKDDFKNLLIENGFEPTENNLKALKILSLNNMDFTEENILNVKNLDIKIDYIANNLHPLTVAKMLKDSFNPMDKNINDIIDYIDNNSFGQTSREKIAEQILDIDKDNKLSKEERDAIVAVYRMLNMVEKGDSIAIGNLLKTEKNVTLANLLQASKISEKNRKNIDFDKKVDENTGESEKIIPDANITKSIQFGIDKANEDYNRFVLGQILNYTSADKINKIDVNINIENLLEQLKDDNRETISKQTKNELVKDVQNLENINGDTINYLIKNDIPITLNNIKVMENIIKENFKLSKDINDFKEELEDRHITFGKSIFNIDDNKNMSKEEAINTVEDLNKENEEIFDDIINLNDLDDIKYMILKNKKVKDSINFMQDNNNIKNGIYKLPMKLSNGKITDLSMYILNNVALNDKNLNLYLNFEDKNSNPIQAYIKVSKQGALANIVTKSNDNIEKYEKDILNILNKFDINPDNIIYSTDSEKDLYKEDDILSIQENFKNMEDNFNIVV
ncbi:DUF6240 domain-containing protein [uncultured Tyzzerella sp.]|uniref:DUF6240 domain-containing protein n=1 Tax=uncultured Tyzzerella sp. TaxID=2321398 RepID=UPI002942B140|nr:DUF6240 domain-containing protein [uncultured Tyzzerella sp.]